MLEAAQAAGIFVLFLLCSWLAVAATVVWTAAGIALFSKGGILKTVAGIGVLLALVYTVVVSMYLFVDWISP
jgi:hypothetical protein